MSATENNGDSSSNQESQSKTQGTCMYENDRLHLELRVRQSAERLDSFY